MPPVVYAAGVSPVLTLKGGSAGTKLSYDVGLEVSEGEVHSSIPV